MPIQVFAPPAYRHACLAARASAASRGKLAGVGVLLRPSSAGPESIQELHCQGSDRGHCRWSTTMTTAVGAGAARAAWAMGTAADPATTAAGAGAQQSPMKMNS